LDLVIPLGDDPWRILRDLQVKDRQDPVGLPEECDANLTQDGIGFAPHELHLGVGVLVLEDEKAADHREQSGTEEHRDEQQKKLVFGTSPRLDEAVRINAKQQRVRNQNCPKERPRTYH
jgi:hypothetical protein